MNYENMEMSIWNMNFENRKISAIHELWKENIYLKQVIYENMKIIPVWYKIINLLQPI